MRILLIGGTRFVGRHLTEALIAAGHEVTLVHRGRTGTELFDGRAKHVLADRDDTAALTAALAEGEWDATIDVCAYFPRHVTTLAAALGGRGGRYVLVSTLSVYTLDEPGFGEDASLIEIDGPVPETITEETYGALKVLCERAAGELFGEGTLILRPTYIVGPWDPYRRLDYWTHRVARGGEILAPGGPDTPVQVVDARDIADFTVACLDEGRAGVFHLVGGSGEYTFAALFADIAAGLGVGEPVVTWVDKAFLEAEGVSDADLPMAGIGDATHDVGGTADPAASLRAGFSARSIARTAAELAGLPLEKGLSGEREAEVLARWRTR
ncbi:hypothetical protein Afil01_36410 [Actinorhabdospora filicis]|uniref:NAD-dependent epimerase/dehydratase domain-containing protein n=1 Tax=Actinorhabdospora filicis TaxID=1785913 RepID=A0A9W6SN04_9ACTN|nr:NAD-dependent epimerase/dehydratase family protein [Actinorhabdospora filicis]GLZ78834.1 hypothetical protein Afil01_36410 [Actinorhabdospora filicis]